MIGRRPEAAFGNSTGDRQMLEYTKAALTLRRQRTYSRLQASERSSLTLRSAKNISRRSRQIK